MSVSDTDGKPRLGRMLAFHERRASIYVPPESTATINDNLNRGRETASELNALRDFRQNFEDCQRFGIDEMFLSKQTSHNQIRKPKNDLRASGKSSRIQADMADALAPYVIGRQRH
ncbi:MAG: hypothetical protein AAF636_21825 [Pseudomonadota bacterium]